MLFEITFLESHDEASIIAELQRVARERGTNRITTRDLDTYGRIGSSTVALRFGSWRRAMNAAGLEPVRFSKSTDEELIAELAKMWMASAQDSGGCPKAKDAAKYSLPVSPATITARFGSWKKALATTARSMNAAGVELPGVQPPSPIILHKRRNPSKSRRFDVFKRDGYTCRICRNAGGELEVDHIVPIAKGGMNTMDNLQTVCKPCNRSKGTKLM